MSFYDELKKPVDNSDAMYRFADSRIGECIGAIRDACLKARAEGRNSIDGMFHADDTDYGTYKIQEIGSFFSTANGFPANYWKDGVEREIRNLGFVDYSVDLISKPETKFDGYSFFGKKIWKETGNTVVGLHIRISW